ncbi:MAG: type IV pilus modification protein PilV [Proteobacteria bacterium]|nr:type IV pilus modification protein PilV [Pseudomonadota bacterium]MBU1648806.1 type IV pilus modification protein PilV [Pseudomonadota bacterium]
MMKSSRKEEHLCQQGFTLIEVLMAMVILGIGIMSFVALQTTDVAFNTSSKKQSHGYLVAMDQIERLLALPYTDPALTVLTSNCAAPSDANHCIDALDNRYNPPVPYRVQWNVIDNTANVANSRLVNVFVRWNGREVARVDFTRVQTSL